MKRILSIVLILILSLGVLTACNDKKVDYNMDNAKATLVDLYPELAPTKDNATPATRKDFHVVKVLTCTDGKYSVAWTTNNDAVKVVEYEGTDTLFNKDTAVTVKLPAVEADLAYTLTATITAPDGNTTAKVEFNLVVPAASAGLTPVTALQPNVGYIFGMYQENKGGYYFLKGGMSGYYMATTNMDDAASALLYYVEETTGGYYLYCNFEGSKQYVNFVVSGTHTNGVYAATPESVFYFNNDGIFSTMVGDTEFGFGTYDQYVTLGPCKTSYTDNFFGYFYAAGSVVPGGNTGSGNTDSGNTGSGSTDSGNTGNAPTPITGVASIVVGQGYKVTAYNSTSNLWATGAITSGRFDCTTNKDDAAVFYVEETTDGYLLYMNVGSTKTYIIMDDKSAGGSTTTNASEATVFVWNADLKTLVVADPDNVRAFGAQNTSTYTNFSTYATSNTEGYNWGQFIAQ